MPEKIKEILEKIKTWWLKFSTKQKTLVISITAVVILALVILSVIMTRPTMLPLITCTDQTQSAAVKELLDGENLDYEVSGDGLTYTINADDQSAANILLGSNSIPTEGYSIDDAIDGSFSTTEADKQKKYQVYLEDKFSRELSELSNVESATVSLNIPADDGTLISRNQETYASVKLELSGEMSEEQAASIARYVATEVGNATTDNITIMDSSANLLFAGGMENSYMGLASSQLSYQAKREAQIESAVVEVLKGTELYDNVSVSPHLELNFDQVTSQETNYSAQDDREEGLITDESHQTSESQGGYAGEPGTDSNDGVTYVIPDDSITSSSMTDDEIHRALDQKDTQTVYSVGDIVYDQSSITVSLANYVYYDEDILRENGTLDDMTFDEFMAENNQRVQTDVDPSLFEMVANATGIPQANITIVSYDIPMFNPSSGSGRTWQDYMQIALAVLIFALLGYVVFRSTRKEKEEDIEPELSVEALLETTRAAEQEELEDIGYNEKSETRVLIEKFVDENPEAVAALLRNWLNEEWN